MQRSKFTLVSPLVVGIFVFAIAGCASSSTETKEPDPSSESEIAAIETTDEGSTADEGSTTGESSGQGEAIFKYGETTYTSNLEFCSLTDSQEAQFHGPAFDESGAQVGYFDGEFSILDSVASGEARIDFGVTELFSSSDEFIAIGDAASHIAMPQFSDTTWGVIGGAWDQNGTVTSSSSVQIFCE